MTAPSRPLQGRRLTLRMLAVSLLATRFPWFTDRATARPAITADEAFDGEAIFLPAGTGMACQLRRYRNGALLRDIRREVGDMTLREFDEFFRHFLNGDTVL